MVNAVMKLSNLIARCAAAAISVALIACADPAEPPADPEAAAQIGDAQTLPNTLPPPSETTPRYVGMWASTSVGCELPAWTIRADSLSTIGEVSCTFDSVQQTSTGYTIQSTCYAEGPGTPAELQLSFAESARAMMIAGGPWDQAPSLVYCGPPSEE
jgi:hypothetical protein